MTRERVTRWLIERGGLLALVTLALYVVLAPQHVVDGDNAEFASLSVTGGVAHPPGYPLYVLWLRALSWLPFASPAHTAAAATGVLGAASVLVLHAACRAWGARALAATLAVGILATGPVMLRVVSEAEVFALNNLVVATVLWLAALGSPVRGAQRAALLGLAAGLGLANQLTCVLVAPVGILGVVRAMREARWPTVLAVAIAGLAVGLLPYAYLMIAPDTPMSWGRIRDLKGVYYMFTRVEYGGPLGFKLSGADVPASTNVLALFATLARGWLYVPLVAGLVALGLRCVRADEGSEPRSGWIALAIAFVVAGPLLVLRFNVPPEGLGLYVNQRFHLLPLLLLAPAVAQVFDRLPQRRERLVGGLVATIGIIALAATSLPYVGRVHSPAVELAAKNMLRTLPEGAVVIHSQDEIHAVSGYVQTALGERRDVVVVTWPLMKLAWYRDRVAKHGVVSAPLAGTPQQQLVATMLARGKPVFVDRLQREIIEAFPTHPYGVLIRVLPRGAPLPGVPEVFAINEELFARFALDYPRPGPDDEFATEVHRRYSATWDMIGKMLEKHGHHAEAARAFEHAKQLAPR